MPAHRISQGGSLLNRARRVSFVWNGKRYEGFEGDSLASALLANGVSLAGRSFKYHRPRGILGAGVEEPNILVQLGAGAQSTPNIKATTLELTDGLQATPVNCWPSPAFDLLGVNRWLKPLLPAAFYYKTFKWPSWHLFEPFIRKAAGLGEAPAEPDPARYDHEFLNIHVLVVGGGLSGLAEAMRAANDGRTVLLAEQEPFWGGRSAGLSDQTDRQIADMVAALQTMPNVTMLLRSTVFGAYDHSSFAVRQRLGDREATSDHPRERLIKLRCDNCVMATGAIERPLLFANNDLPGVMLASAARTYLARHAVVVGNHIGLVTNNDEGWQVAIDLLREGVVPAFVADLRERHDQGAWSTVADHGVPVYASVIPKRTLGSKRVKGLQIDVHGKSMSLPCDSLLVSGGFNPVVHLHSQAGGKLDWDERISAFVPSTGSPHIRAAGRAAGEGLPDCPPIAVPLAADPKGASLTWVDFQNDVTVADIGLAERESFSAVEHLKRYTTLGMATDQGKTSNINGLAVMGAITGRRPSLVGTTKFRPPYEPVTVGTIAGANVRDGLDRKQRLPAHEVHISLGAQMDEYGNHWRPAAYPQANETLGEAIVREVLAVRNGVGLFDASPLGKIELHGPDAARLADLCVVSTVSNLKRGRCRYALTCSETGIVVDDGIVSHFEDGTFVLGTSSAGIHRVYGQIEEYLQCFWPELEVAAIDTTGIWGVLTIAGPHARAVLEKCDLGVDFVTENFPHLACRLGRFQGSALRVSRVSYSGELSFELAVRADRTAELAGVLMRAGEEFGITPFGIEALDIMRIEKGFIHVGNETDGATMPQDLGFAGPLAKKKSDFVGRRGATMQVGRDAGRKELVGLLVEGSEHLPVGAHAKARIGNGSDGYVTSSLFSPTLGRPHALGMIAGGRSRMGEVIELFDIGDDNRGRSMKAKIIEPCAYDPEGGRMNDAL